MTFAAVSILTIFARFVNTSGVTPLVTVSPTRKGEALFTVTLTPLTADTVAVPVAAAAPPDPVALASCTSTVRLFPAIPSAFARTLNAVSAVGVLPFLMSQTAAFPVPTHDMRLTAAVVEEAADAVREIEDPRQRDAD